MDGWLAALEAHGAEPVPAGAAAFARYALQGPPCCPAGCCPGDSTVSSLIRDANRRRHAAAGEHLRARDAGFVRGLLDGHIHDNDRIPRMIERHVDADRLADAIVSCGDPARCLARMRSWMGYDRSCQPVVRAMLAKRDWRAYYGVLCRVASDAEKCRMLHRGFSGGPPEEEDEKLLFVYDSMQRKPASFGCFPHASLCRDWFPGPHCGPMPTVLARLVCDNQVRCIEGWGGRYAYPDGSASGFHRAFDRIRFEDEEAASELYDRVVDAMRLRHPEPRSLCDRKVLERGRLDGTFAAVVTCGVMLENRRLARRVRELERAGP